MTHPINLSGEILLIPDGGHIYREAYVVARKVAYNKKRRLYSEYAGDEHLGTDEEVVTRWVAE